MTTENQSPEGAPDLRTAFESWALHTPPDERTNWEVFQAGARAALAAQPAPQPTLTHDEMQAEALKRYPRGDAALAFFNGAVWAAKPARPSPAEGDAVGAALRTGLEMAQELLAMKREALGDDYRLTRNYWEAEREITAAIAAHEAKPQPKGASYSTTDGVRCDHCRLTLSAHGDGGRTCPAPSPAPAPDEQFEAWRVRLWELIDAYRKGHNWPLACRDRLKSHIERCPRPSPAVGAQSQEAQDAAWRKWDDTGTIGSLIAFLATLDQAERIVTAYHITLGSGERRCKTRRLTISRERVDHTTSTIRMGDSSLPYTHVMWAHPRELVLDVDEAFKRFANDYWPPAMTDSMRATEAHQRAAFQAGVNAASQPPVQGKEGA